MFVVFILGFCLFALAQDLKNKPLKNTIMNIEVTKETFYKLFNKEPFEVEQKETHEIHHYKNRGIKQRGFKVWNYTSSIVHQYYLTDINA